MTCDDILTVDDGVAATQADMSDEMIIADVREGENAEANQEENEEEGLEQDETSIQKPSAAQIREAIDSIMNFSMFTEIDEMRIMVMKTSKAAESEFAHTAHQFFKMADKADGCVETYDMEKIIIAAINHIRLVWNKKATMETIYNYTKKYNNVDSMEEFKDSFDNMLNTGKLTTRGEGERESIFVNKDLCACTELLLTTENELRSGNEEDTGSDMIIDRFREFEEKLSCITTSMEALKTRLDIPTTQEHKENSCHYSTDYAERDKLIKCLQEEITFLRDEIKTKNVIIKILVENSSMRDDAKYLSQATDINLQEKSLNSENIDVTNDSNAEKFITPKKKGRRLIKSIILANDDDNKVITNNRYSILENVESYETFGSYNANVTSDNETQHVERSKKMPSNHNKGTTKKARKNNSKTTIILGDSIIKNVDGWRMKKALKTDDRICVRSVASATSTQMIHYAQCVLEENPDKVILHVGTNDINSTKSTDEIANKIMEVVDVIQQRDKEVIVSALIRRNNNECNNKVMQVNTSLKSRCADRSIIFIENGNLEKSHLNKSGLHLNKQWYQYFSKKLCKYFKLTM